MAYAGYFIKVGASEVELPLKFISPQTYNISPEQPLDLDSGRTLDGVLERTVLEHAPSKIEFETPSITNSDLAELSNILKNAYISDRERNLTVKYYNPADDDYLTGEFYVPTINYPINFIRTNNQIVYNPIRIAFIEY